MTGRANRRGWGHIRRLPSKRYQASYVHADTRHAAPITFTSRTDAEGWLSTERRLIERGEWTSPQSRSEAHRAVLTLGEYASAWIAQRSLKTRTRLHYGALLNDHITPVFKNVPLGAITPAMVREWHAKTLVGAPAYRSHAYALLHAICATAVKDGLLAANPCQIDRAGRTHTRREPVILTVAEVGQVASVMEERLKALVLLSAWCGLRWGEVTELRRKDVGEGAAVICVARGVTHRGGCHIDAPKSGKVRRVVVPPHIRSDLKHHLDTFVNEDPQTLLFAPTGNFCHLGDKAFRDRFNAALAQIGREGVRIHDLRHFAGTQTARVGSLRETMDRLGHSTVGASLIYQQAVSGRDVEVAEALSRLAEPDTA